MLASRLLTILMLLQTRGRMSAQALAAEVEVSVRTLYRDIDQLSAAGVPVYAERGRNGGFELLDGWRTRLTGLTQPEAEALFLAGLPGPASELGLGEAMAQARLKLLAALPESWRSDAGRLGGRFHLDPADWRREAAPPEHLRAVAEAVWTRAPVRMLYASWKGEVERTTEPLGVVLKAGAWYMLARVEGMVRTYRISEIRSIELLEGAFEPPPGFHLAAAWREATTRFETEVYQGRALARLSPRGVARLKYLGGLRIEVLPDPPDAQGWRRAIIPFETIVQACEDLLVLGAELEVLEPAGLRDALREAAGRIASLYA